MSFERALRFLELLSVNTAIFLSFLKLQETKSFVCCE
jgi:hypothetical protein